MFTKYSIKRIAPILAISMSLFVTKLYSEQSAESVDDIVFKKSADDVIQAQTNKFAQNQNSQNKGLTARLDSDANVGYVSNIRPIQTVTIERDRRMQLSIEQTVPQFNSKGDASRYVADKIGEKLGSVAVYAKTPKVVSKEENAKYFTSSFGLRNFIEPDFSIKFKNMLESGFNTKLESRVGKPLEVKITKDFRFYGSKTNGEMGAYFNVNKQGYSQGLLGLQVRF